ncbi:MAG: anthranilate phosphoribosyltransferase [Actinobacteria bacterium]|uniref:anthranilate phosphoribosyltransferase n=1 Tax=freshwater metagenome TaxID=449393 RepID=A0A6J6GW56_9ZZZZ|nr:anthranilate phosphoribosyltransferase [Actinomycetota bacterium]
MNWELVFTALAEKKDLSPEQIKWCMNQILIGAASLDQTKHFLLGLKNKGETPSEVIALVDQMYALAAPINIPDRAVDTVGTGGDGANTINISTTAAIITNAAGARVVKHGNRAASSKSGSADLLEALGVRIDLTGAEVEKTVSKIGIGFCFAPMFHSSMKHAAPARKELGVPTIFNILGPLSNPAKPKAAAIGVARKELLPLVSEVLLNQGKEGFVFRGDDGLDEVSLSGPTTVYQIHDGNINVETFDPVEIGIARSEIHELLGGDAEFNASITAKIFAGESGAPRDAVTLNAAFAIAAFKADFHLPLETQIANAYVLANQAIDSGAAASVLKKWVDLTNEIASAR